MAGSTPKTSASKGEEDRRYPPRRPLDHDRGKWLKTEGREIMLAGYIGFTKNMRKIGPFQSADDEWTELQKIASTESDVLAICPGASADYAKSQRYRRLAWSCIRVMTQVEPYNENSDDQNKAESKDKLDRALEAANKK